MLQNIDNCNQIPKRGEMQKGPSSRPLRDLLQASDVYQKLKNSTRRIFARSIDVDDGFLFPHYTKSEETFEFLNSVFLKNLVMKSLNDEQRLALIFAMSREIFPAGTVIIQEGNKNDFFYVIEQGNVVFYVESEISGTWGPGEAFWELANCTAATDCTLWKLDIRIFRHILNNKCHFSEYRRVYKTLKRIPCSVNLNETELIGMIQSCNIEKFEKGERIATKSKVGQRFHIIHEGKIKIHNIWFQDGRSRYVDYTLGPGEFFCERALWHVTATSNCTTLSLSLDVCEKNLGLSDGLINSLPKRNILMGISILANSTLESHQISQLAEVFTERVFLEGEYLLEKGKPVELQGIYIIQTGRVTITDDDGTTDTFSCGDYFGDSFIQAEEGSISKQTIKIEKKTICAVLTKSSIESIIGTVSHLGRPLHAMTNLDNSIEIEHLHKYRVIGVGNFSVVRLASHKHSHKPYALKIISKYQAIKENKAEAIIREKNILASIHHPFIVKIVSTFQNECFLYLLLDFVQGGMLSKVIRSVRLHGILTETFPFYAACILEALSHLHHHQICYRNLAQENVLIDKDGYCVLVGFKHAKVVFGKTYTFCGTPQYLAPEIILCKGHNRNVDYWAFDVLVYEMLFGENPFYIDDIDQVTLFKRVVKARYSFPLEVLYDKSTEQLIRGLLSRKQTSCLGNLTGDIEIRKHAWFTQVDFEGILKKEVQPSWLPKIKGDLDPSNFGTHDDLEKNEYRLRKKLSTEQQKRFCDF